MAVFLFLIIMQDKAHSQPDTLWTKSHYGVAYNALSMQVIRTSDEGFASCGSAYGGDEERRDVDFGIVKTDSLGRYEWSGIYEGTPNGGHQNDNAFCLSQLSDDGYYLAGKSGGGYIGMVVRIDSTGEELWTDYFGGEDGFIIFEACTIDEDDNFLGVSQNNILKLNSDGEEIWRQEYGETRSEWFYSIDRTSDDGYILGGTTRSLGEGGDMYVVKIDADGEIEWERSYGTENADFCSEIVATDDGGYCLVGSSRFGVTNNIYPIMVRIDAEGEEIWQQVYSDYPRGDVFKDVVQTADGGFAAAGYGQTDYYLLRTNADGEVLWRTYYDLAFDRCYSIILLEDGGYLLGGGSTDYGTWLVRTEPDPLFDSVPGLLDPAYPSDFIVEAAFPNPFNCMVTIPYRMRVSSEVKIIVFNSFGRRVVLLLSEIRSPGSHQVSWISESNPSGTYMVSVSTGSLSSMTQVTLVK